MQALVYSMDDEVIRAAFADLLAADMNTDTKARTHPAFTEIIKEITAVEARILKLIETQGQVEFRVRAQSGDTWSDLGYRYSFEFPDAETAQVRRGVSNLKRLELLETRFNEWPVIAGLDEQEKKLREIFRPMIDRLANLSEEARKAAGWAGPTPSLNVMKYGIFLTPLGDDFVRICLKSAAR
jgi:hypothetical protein